MSDRTANEAQQKVISHKTGPMQVIAGPGSGKTYTIVQRILSLLNDTNVSPSEILVITFTKAAATEMKNRYLKEAGCSNTQINFGTFHGVFYHILKHSDKYKQYSLITETEKRKIVEQMLCNHADIEKQGYENTGDILLQISKAKNTNRQPGWDQDGILEPEVFQMVYKEYLELCETMQKMDFDDLLLACYELLKNREDLCRFWQKKFTYIMVDEFQDCNWLQYQILKLLATPQNNVVVVGDDDQAIYGFRGADVGIMRSFMEDYPQADRELLTTNYRSTEQIVQAAQLVIAQNLERYTKELCAKRSGETIRMKSCLDEKEEENYLIEQIKNMPTSIQNSSAVIFRTNAEAGHFALQLACDRIPFQLKEKAKDIFSHEIAQDMLHYLLFANGESTRTHFYKIMNKPVRYINRQAVPESEVDKKKLLQYYANNRALSQTVEKLYMDLDRMKKLSPFLAVNYLRKAMGYDYYQREKYTGEEYENRMLLADTVQNSMKGCKTVKQWQELIQEYQKACLQQEQAKKKEGITLITMHAAKGLEYETVLIPHCNEGSIPGKRSIASQQGIEEERRLLYVAMTRAKNKLILSYVSNKKRTPSRFLEPLLTQSYSSTNSSNSALSRYSSKASATASYSSSSSMNSNVGSAFTSFSSSK